MAVTDYDQRRTTAINRLMRLIAPILWRFVGEKLSTAVIRTLAESLLPHVNKARSEFITIARDYYTKTLREYAPDADPIDAPAIAEFTADNLTNVLAEVLPVDEPVREAHIEKAMIASAHQADQAERNTTMAHAIHDDNIRGWARYDPEPPMCPICAIAIARGPVFRSKESAGGHVIEGGQNKFHKGDTCRVVLVPKNTDSWEGSEQTAQYKNLYEKHSKGKSSKQGFRDFSKAVRAEQKAAQAPGPTRRNAEHEADKSRPSD